MAFRFTLAGQKLQRDGSYLDPTQPFTFQQQFKSGATTPSGGDFRINWTYGDWAGGVNPYIYLGTFPNSRDILVEVFDGVATYTDTTPVYTPPSPAEWKNVAFSYNGSALHLFINGVQVASVAIDMSAFVFANTDEIILPSNGDYDFTQIRVWQAALTECELAREGASPTPVRTANLLAATTLTSNLDLTDPVGGNDWTLTGTPSNTAGPSYKIPVGSLAFSGFGDDPMKFHTPAGVDLGAPSYAPYISDGGGHGCDGIVQMDNGIFGVTDAQYIASGNVNAAALDSQLHVTPLGGEVAPAGGGFRSIASDYTDNFYGIQTPVATNAFVAKFNSLGAQVDAFDLGAVLFPSRTVLGMAPDESAAYFAIVNAAAVSKRNIAGASTSTFTTETGFRVKANNILVLRTGDVLIGWQKAATPGYVKHYNASGTLLYTYSLTGTNPMPIVLTPGLTDDSFFVSYYTTSAATSSGVRVAEVETVTGAILNSFDPDDGLSFQYDGPCCVVREQILLSVECPPATAGVVGTPYSSFVVADGGTEPYTYSISSGVLPGGLTLDAATGEISGTPTTVETQAFTVQVTDDDGTIATSVCSCSITISAAGAGITTTYPNTPGFVGNPYTISPTTSGGTPPYAYSICVGSDPLPPGLTIDPVTGIISGTPTTPGTYTFTVCIDDVATGTGQVVVNVAVFKAFDYGLHIRRVLPLRLGTKR